MNNKKIKILHVAQANGGVSEYLKSFLKYSNKNIFQNYLLVSNLYKTEEEMWANRLETKERLNKFKK